ncbi:MAG: hypothetical protein GX491_02155 [Chloroflexi bacterium]|nr:hypothetical protein [Chloroflexota bacterium]
MTERSIYAGETPNIVIRTGGDAVVKAWDSDRVLAESSSIWGLQVRRKEGKIEVQLGGSGQVFVPAGSNIGVYAGKSAEIQSVQGTISAFAGLDVRIHEGNLLAQAGAGRSMDIDCQTVVGKELRLNAGRDLRCWFRSLRDVRYLIDDLGGRWETVLGDGGTLIYLKAGGDVTLVTAGEVAGQPPDFILGKVERPQVD